MAELECQDCENQKCQLEFQYSLQQFQVLPNMLSDFEGGAAINKSALLEVLLRTFLLPLLTDSIQILIYLQHCIKRTDL